MTTGVAVTLGHSRAIDSATIGARRRHQALSGVSVAMDLALSRKPAI